MAPRGTAGEGVGHARRVKLTGNLNLSDVSPIFMILIGQGYKFSSKVRLPFTFVLIAGVIYNHACYMDSIQSVRMTVNTKIAFTLKLTFLFN